jgi:hypothetical protein
MSMIGELVRIELNISDIRLREWGSNNRTHGSHIPLKDTTTAGLIIEIEYATECIWMAVLRAGELWISYAFVHKKRLFINRRELEARIRKNNCWLPTKRNTLRLWGYQNIPNKQNKAKVEAKHDQAYCKIRVQYETFVSCVFV